MYSITKILSLLSKRHMLLVIYTLSDQSRGFNDLQDALKINTATLSRRLRELEHAGMLTKRRCTHDSRCSFYNLNTRGKRISELLHNLSKA